MGFVTKSGWYRRKRGNIYVRRGFEEEATVIAYCQATIKHFPGREMSKIALEMYVALVQQFPLQFSLRKQTECVRIFSHSLVITWGQTKCWQDYMIEY